MRNPTALLFYLFTETTQCIVIFEMLSYKLHYFLTKYKAIHGMLLQILELSFRRYFKLFLNNVQTEQEQIRIYYLLIVSL